MYPLNEDGTTKYAEPSFVFQAGPLEELGYESTFDHTDYMTVNAGEFSRPLGRKLRTITFDTLVTEGNPSWAAYSRPEGWREGIDNLPRAPRANRETSVEAHVRRLREMCDDGRPFLLVITPPGVFPLNGTAVNTLITMNATIRSLRVTEKAGEPETKYLSLQCTEYRVPVLTSGSNAGSRPGSKAAKHTLTMQYDPKKKKWTIVVVSPRNSPAAKEIRALAKKGNVTVSSLAKAVYGYGYQDRKKAVLKANESLLGRRWKSLTKLEKAAKFKSGKKQKFVIPEEK